MAADPDVAALLWSNPGAGGQTRPLRPAGAAPLPGRVTADGPMPLGDCDTCKRAGRVSISGVGTVPPADCYLLSWSGQGLATHLSCDARGPEDQPGASPPLPQAQNLLLGVPLQAEVWG